MKNLKMLISFTVFLVITAGICLTLAVDYFGWNSVENTLLLLFALFMFFAGRYTTRIDMYNGAKVVLASQESDDRRERAGLTAVGEFIKNTARPALPPGHQGGHDEYVVSDDLAFQDADYTFSDE